MSWVLRKLFLIFVLGGALSVGTAAAYVQLLAADLPELTSLKDYQPPITSNLYDRKGRLIDRFYKERRTPVAYAQIPKHVINAFVAAEDAAFFEHHGIDYMAVFKAGLNEIKYRFIGGSRRGGSTITQQTAKTFLLSPERTYTRKIKEMLLAKKIEENFSKEEILFLYLNQIYFGKGAYGVEEAAQTYYGKPISKISLGQAAVLASIPKSPSKINPDVNPKRVKERRTYVLEQMRHHGLISKKEFEQAQQESIRRKQPPHTYLRSAPYFSEEVRRQLKNIKSVESVTEGGYQIFSTVDADYQKAAIESLRNGLEQLSQRRGWRGPFLRPDALQKKKLYQIIENDKNIRFEGLEKESKLIWNWARVAKNGLNRNDTDIRQNLENIQLEKNARIVVPVHDVDAQNRVIFLDLGSQLGVVTYAGFKWVRSKVRRNKPIDDPSQIVNKGDLVYVKLSKINGYRNFPEFHLLQRPQAQGALVALSPQSREVLALVGGYDYGESKFNRATQAKRQPGSALKPFLYALALAQQKVTAATIITDAPKVYVDPDTGERWQPNNSGDNFRGDISLRRCLRHSINTCSIELLDNYVSIKDFLEFSALVGLNTIETPFPRNLSIALGTPELTLAQLVNAFASFPAKGVYQPLTLLNEVKSPAGQQLYAPQTQQVQVLSPQVAYVTTDLLQDVVQNGTAQRAKSLGRPVAGKTGTTNEARSAWFVGFTPELVVGVYVGMDDNTSLGAHEYGSKAALPIWRSFMKEALSKKKIVKFTAPKEGVTKRIINIKSGLLADLAEPKIDSEPKETNGFKAGTMLSGILSQVFEKLGSETQEETNEESATSLDSSTRQKQEDAYEFGGRPLPPEARWEYFVTGTEPKKLHSTLPPPPLEILEGIGFSP